ncbi:prolyl oligopeptidase family serine peptidase [Streptomyces sp. NPDC056323]|uniref:prolyl oligopeptidase family serine peptidase n=1 Tax=Streptomyces sp. NPDC056323 TaxID=3345784 RepID=UPI0035E0403A
MTAIQAPVFIDNGDSDPMILLRCSHLLAGLIPTSLDSLVTREAPPFFLWHTAEDVYVPPEHTYRLASVLAAHEVPHTVHVFPHGPHSLGPAEGAGQAAAWTRFAEP